MQLRFDGGISKIMLQINRVHRRHPAAFAQHRLEEFSRVRKILFAGAVAAGGAGVGVIRSCQTVGSRFDIQVEHQLHGRAVEEPHRLLEGLHCQECPDGFEVLLSIDAGE